MTKRTSDQVCDEIAQINLGRDIDLSSSIRERIRKDNSRKMNAKKVVIIATAVILASVILATIPGVAQALKKIFAYIPGAGVVEQSSPLRILEEPVQVVDGETILSVQQGVADAEITTILYQVDNLFASADENATGTETLCDQIPQLQLADGSMLSGATVSGDFWRTGYTRHLEFPALPASENEVKLVFTCLEGTPVTDESQPIEVSLKFVEAPADLTVYPIVDLPTPEGLVEGDAASSEDENAISGISFSLQNYVQTDEDILLFGLLKENSDDLRIAYVDEADVHLTDANGVSIPLSQDYTVSNPDASPVDENSKALTYRSGGRYNPGQATMTIDSVWVILETEKTFSFDPGTNPQPGQTWTVNESLQVADYTILVKEIAMNETGDGLIFTLEKPENVNEVNLLDLDHPQLGGGGGEGTSLNYEEGFPEGPINITLLGITAELEGPWQVTADLPAFADGGSPVLPSEACLTYSSWNAALASASALPGELTGTLTLADTLEPSFYYHVLTTNLNGNEPIDRGLGSDASMSPDGKMLVYEVEQGLILQDLSSGQQNLVPDTTRRDRDPLWSPDGKLIAFTRGPESGLDGGPGPYSLVIMNADGSNQKMLLDDSFANHAQAWLLDSSKLIYTVEGSEGVSVRTIDIASGAISENFEINYVNASVVLSPDQSRVAYEAMLPGEKYAVYTANLDGSDPKLIANADPIVVTNPYWSPDGQWLIVSVTDTLVNENHPVLALVQMDTCQVIPLTNMFGRVTSWK
jgi:hypothetical protein